MDNEVLLGLEEAVLQYDADGAEQWARKAIDENVDPAKALDTLTSAIRQVGEGFGTGELFLPDLVGAADAMQRALPILEEAVEKSGGSRKSLGTVVIGTVKGDVHTIGKDMVATLLRAEGFAVADMGINVSAQQFLEAIRTQNADILAMSALMTTTAPVQKKVIAMLEEEGLRDAVKVMVGGGAITQDFANNIGADGYGATAPSAVKVARRLVQE
ncbi:MAG: corrinoid protein [Ardenticatenia bacterium]|nr:corrinoid protein [Ardenticatenia bacterium]